MIYRCKYFIFKRKTPYTLRNKNAKPRNASAKRMQTLPVPLRRAEPLPHRSSALCIRQNLAKPEL